MQYYLAPGNSSISDLPEDTICSFYGSYQLQTSEAVDFDFEPVQCIMKSPPPPTTIPLPPTTTEVVTTTEASTSTATSTSETNTSVSEGGTTTTSSVSEGKGINKFGNLNFQHHRCTIMQN